MYGKNSSENMSLDFEKKVINQVGNSSGDIIRNSNELSFAKNQ